MIFDIANEFEEMGRYYLLYCRSRVVIESKLSGIISQFITNYYENDSYNRQYGDYKRSYKHSILKWIVIIKEILIINEIAADITDNCEEVRNC